ncbi:MAG: SpoIID/LytB domain-containing protein [Nitrospiraceae bacterium]|nr:SpoIID/LytB domain-containing protein [Nitrospiraceae bacterium]
MSENSSCKKYAVFIAAIFFIFSFLFNAYAETIRVLILEESFNKIPEKNEYLEKIGEKQKGELLANGIHYKGDIEVWQGTNGLYVIAEIPFEDYVKDVVFAEVGSKWEVEALKAQAVVSRTYALYHKNANGKSLYHITSSVLHQVYKGDIFDPAIATAVEKTAGEVLTYEGKIIEAFYHSTCGGKTELPDEVFGKSFPFLKSVEPVCETSPYKLWDRRIPAAEIEKACNVQSIKDIIIKTFTSTGRVNELEIITETGKTTIKATELRRLLGWQRLPSTSFTISKENGSVFFEGKGYGHGVGLCQWSALEMAGKGMNYKDILAYFYPGTKIRIHEGHK